MYDKDLDKYDLDGKKVSYYSLLDKTFMGLDISKGKHTIKIVNVDEKFKWYLVISFLSLFVTILIYLYGNKKILKKY